MRRLSCIASCLLAASLLPAQSHGSARGGSSVKVTTESGSTGSTGTTTVTTTPPRPEPPPELSLDWRERMRKTFAADEALRLRLHGLADANGDGKLEPNEESELELLFRILFLAELAGRAAPLPQPRDHARPEQPADWPQRLRQACAADDALRGRLHKLADADRDGALTPTEEARMVFLFRSYTEARAPAGAAAPKPKQAKVAPPLPQQEAAPPAKPKNPGRGGGKGK
jgi:hypothetical protein